MRAAELEDRDIQGVKKTLQEHIDTPTILGALFTKTDPDIITRDLAAAQGSGTIDILLLFGFAASIPLVDWVGRIPLQITGFIGCAVGLAIGSRAMRTRKAILFPYK